MKRFMTQVRILKKGHPIKCTVSMYISAGWLAYENTESVRTDSLGVARIPHEKKGKANVYVDGRKLRETPSVPTEVTIDLD